MAELGTYIAEKYEILKLVGKGGMSEVYLAMDKNLNKQWAVKEIKKEARDKNNRIVIQSAIAEANMMKQLDHPCLPRVVDILDKFRQLNVIEKLNFQIQIIFYFFEFFINSAISVK